MSVTVTFEQVRDFLCEQWGVWPERLTRSTRLLQDLGIDGDDAEEILMEFAERFQVDFSSFPFGEHFGGELGAGPRWVLKTVLADDDLGKLPITLQDLVDAANRGRWIEPDKSAD